MEKRGITLELPKDSKEEKPNYPQDLQDELSSRLIKQIKEAKDKNGATISRTVITDSRSGRA